MSQEKVARYKEEKANRKERLAKEKRKRAIIKACTTLVGLALCVWIGISAVDAVQRNRPVKTIYVNTTEVDDYIRALYADSTENSDTLE